MTDHALISGSSLGGLKGVKPPEAFPFQLCPGEAPLPNTPAQGSFLTVGTSQKTKSAYFGLVLVFQRNKYLVILLVGGKIKKNQPQQRD